MAVFKSPVLVILSAFLSAFALLFLQSHEIYCDLQKGEKHAKISGNAAVKTGIELEPENNKHILEYTKSASLGKFVEKHNLKENVAPQLPEFFSNLQEYTSAQEYPVGTQGYPVGTQGYPVGTQGYPVGTQGYPVSTQGYPLSTQGSAQVYQGAEVFPTAQGYLSAPVLPEAAPVSVPLQVMPYPYAQQLVQAPATINGTAIGEAIQQLTCNVNYDVCGPNDVSKILAKNYVNTAGRSFSCTCKQIFSNLACGLLGENKEKNAAVFSMDDPDTGNITVKLIASDCEAIKIACQSSKAEQSSQNATESDALAAITALQKPTSLLQNLVKVSTIKKHDNAIVVSPRNQMLERNGEFLVSENRIIGEVANSEHMTIFNEKSEDKQSVLTPPQINFSYMQTEPAEACKDVKFPADFLTADDKKYSIIASGLADDEKDSALQLDAKGVVAAAAEAATGNLKPKYESSQTTAV